MSLKLQPTSTIIANLGLPNGGPVHAFFTNECARAMNDFIPYRGRSGKDHLRYNREIHTTYIKYNMPYARYQYYGVREDGTHRVVNYTTPGTGPYWDKQMWTAKSTEITQSVQDYIKTHGGK